jgi:hypothetical protein
MPISVQIPDSEIAIITGAYATEAVIAQLYKKPEKEEVEATMPIPFKAGEPKSEGYNRSDTIINKIIFVLNENEASMTTREIIERLYELDPPLRANKALTSKNVSAVISANTGKDKLLQRWDKSEDRREYLYSVR